MKQQSDPKKTNYYRAYNDTKPFHVRRKELIDSIPDRCWWIKEYLKSTYRYPSQK